MSRRRGMRTFWLRIRSLQARRAAAWRRARPAPETLECRLTLSVGGGWISGNQSGQSGVGFLGQYFSNPTLSGNPSFTRWDDQVDFSWSNSNASPGGSPDPAFALVGPGGWSAGWTGTLTANFSETYTFQVNSAGNGVRLWVTPVGQTQGSPLIDDWTDHAQATDTATMTLQAGQDYAVALQCSQGTASTQQVQLQWSSPSTPLEDIEPATQVGVNTEGGDALFANMVNGGTRTTWWLPGSMSQTVPTDANLWPTVDARILLGEGDTSTGAGGSYLVQFTGAATVTDWPQVVDWWVGGVDLHSSTLQAGQGYNPSTNTTTATMVVTPTGALGDYLTFTNTGRNPGPALQVTAISEVHGTVTVSVPSVAGLATNQKATIAGFTGAAANYDGTFAITGVNVANNTFTYTDPYGGLPTNPGGGTALVDAGDGITNLYVMQPSTLGGSTPMPVGTLFMPASLSMAAQFTTLRFMDLNDTNGNLTSNWSDRTLVSDNFWTAYTFNSGTGVDSGVSGQSHGAGVPWEVQVALANESGKDVYINVPSNASANYLTNLADLFAYGSDGVNPYTSVQTNPVWKPLDPNLKIYIELSNETWNSSFVQAQSRSDGWANQLSQRALYDYLTNNQNDPLYPGGGAAAYTDGAVLASYYNVTSSNDGPFLATYNASPASSTDGGSPAYFSNAASINGYVVGQGWIGLRDVQISNAFKTVFGETGINASATSSRVRPVLEWQNGGNGSGGLGFINAVYGGQLPVGYYLYGGGGVWYANNNVGGFSDVSFANPAFASGLAGWSSSGSAGVAANGSSLGNPNAPPLFSAIAIANGATESGNTVTISTASAHSFAVGQSVNVSGVTINSYNGTFTITSVTATSFTYTDNATGLANSGDGIVTGTGASAQTAYLQPGASISQNITFSGGYADITLFAAQSVPASASYGLTITLTPTDGGPAINNGQSIPESEGAASYSGIQNAFAWDRSAAFYTGASDYTYTVTFTNTLPSGTVFLDNLAIQTVNGMFNETTAALQNTSLNISGIVEADVGLTLQYGLHEVGYEGGYDFNQNLSGYLDPNGYMDMRRRGYSSNVPNVGMYANLDPRTGPLAIQTLDEYYAAGGVLPVVYEANGNINSWGVAVPTPFNVQTPKLQAAIAVEQTTQPATYGLTPGQSATSTAWWLNTGQGLDSTYLVPAGTYTVTMRFYPVSSAPVGQIDPVNVLVDGQFITSVNVPTKAGGTFTVLLGPVAAGQHSVELINTAPASNANLYLGSPGGPVFTVNVNTQATPSITWPPPGPIVSGTALTAASLDATANVPGTFTYWPAVGAVLPLGVDSLSVTFTPTDTTDYTSVTATAQIYVVPTVPTSVYVASAYAGDALGTAVTWSDGSTHYIGFDAFGTIQPAINFIAASGTVNVAPGTYTEVLTINRSLSLVGAGATSTTIQIPSGSIGNQIEIAGGFTVTLSGFSLAGNTTSTGIDVNGGYLGATNLTIVGDSVGVSVEHGGSVTINASAINGSNTGILIGSGPSDTGTLTAMNDSFAGDNVGVQNNQSGMPITATMDWWGSITGPANAANPGGIGAAVVGGVNFSPWVGDANLIAVDSLVYLSTTGNAFVVTPSSGNTSLSISLNGALTGSIPGGDTLSFAGTGGTVTINGESGPGSVDVFTINDTSVQFSAGDPLSGTTIAFLGTSVNRYVDAQGTINTFNIQGAGAGGPSGALVGGPGANAFVFGPTGNLLGSIQGGGTGSLNDAAYASGVTINLGDGTNGTATGVSGTITGITTLIGSNFDDTLSAGTVPAVAMTGGLGTNLLSGTGAGDSVAESIASGYTLSNAMLTGTGAGFTDNLSGITVASLTGVSAVSDTFAVSGWTGTGSLSAPPGTGTITATEGGGFILANTSLSSTNGMTLGLSGFTSANLSDSTGGNTFNINGWTGSGSFQGTADTLVDSVSTAVNLSNTSLAVAGLPALAISGLITVNLTDTSGGNAFNITGWTGTGSLTNSGSATDSVADSASGGFTLTNTSLSSGGMSMSLSGFTTAYLSDTSGGNAFNLTGWTGSGSFQGTADTLVNSVSVAVNLSNTALVVAGLPALAISGFTTANLTDTTGGHTFNITGWTGSGSLTDSGAATDSVADSASGGFTLTNTSLSSGGMSMSLGGFATANLTDTSGGHTFNITGWTGSGSLTDSGAAAESVVDSASGGFTLTNTSLSSGGMSMSLSGIAGASLTDTSQGGNTFNITGWTGVGSFQGTADTLVDSVSAGVNLSNTSLAVAGLPALAIGGFTTAYLSDTTSGHTFNITGWTGGGSFQGAADTLVDSVSAAVSLSNASLAVAGLPSLTISGFTSANLTDTSGGHTFNITGWTGNGSLINSGATTDSVTDSVSGGFTLTNTSLASGAMSMSLSGFTTANLADTTSGHTFNITGWTGGGSFQGTADTLVDSVSTAINLSNTSLSVAGLPALAISGFTSANLSDTSGGGHTFTVTGWTGGGSLSGHSENVTLSASTNVTLTSTSLSAGSMSLGLSGITSANLTVTASSGHPVYVVDASAFTGTTALSATGTVAAVLFGGSGAGSSLTTSSSGNSILIGGAGGDTLLDTGTGFNILIGAGGSDTITGNGNDILISGTTSYDANKQANLNALDAILAEWVSSDSYATRISKITSGVGPGGKAKLNSSTVQSDQVTDNLSDGSGSTQNNWFIASRGDTVTKKSNETETII